MTKFNSILTQQNLTSFNRIFNFLKLKISNCGPNLDDDLGYRTAKEINSYRERDPIYIIKQELINNKNLSDVIKIIEDFLPSYISKIYESVKGIENIHPLLTEQDCYHSL